MFRVLLLAAAAVPAIASARPVTITVDGEVRRFLQGEGPVYGLDIGSPIRVRATYDTDDVFVTSYDFTGAPSPGVVTFAPLDRPGASLLVTGGDASWAATDDGGFGFGFPGLVFIDGAFFGLDALLVNADGQALSFFPVGVEVGATEPSFIPGLFNGGPDLLDQDEPFDQPRFGGRLDLGTFAEVPAPAALALFGLGAAALIRRRARG